MRRINYITQFFSIAMAGVILLSGCSSTTLIQTEPSGASVYLDNEKVGVTPYTMNDTKITGTCTSVRFEMEGYEDFNTSICRNEEVDAGAIVGGIFFLFPFIWTMKYKPTHMYELIPASNNDQENKEYIKEKDTTDIDSKADRLREIKQLFDEGILTQEEYEKEKAKILEED